MRDLHSNMRTKNAVTAVALGATGNNAGLVIDRQGYGGVEFVITYGSITTTGSIVTALVQSGAATGSLTSVADGDLLEIPWFDSTLKPLRRKSVSVKKPTIEPASVIPRARVDPPLT